MTLPIAGGTGTLGTQVVRLLAARDLPLRVLTRHPDNAERMASGQAEVVAGDVRDPAAVARAMDGIARVVSTVHVIHERFAPSAGRENHQTPSRNAALVRRIPILVTRKAECCHRQEHRPNTRERI